MKHIEYTMRVKYADNSSAWNEDNGADVQDNMTIGQHAQITVNNYNKKNLAKKYVFVMARELPNKLLKKVLKTNAAPKF